MYCLPVPEARILEAGYQEGHTPSKTYRAEASLAFSGGRPVSGVLSTFSLDISPFIYYGHFISTHQSCYRRIYPTLV